MKRDQALRLKAEEEIKKYEDVVNADPYRQCYHVMPPVGLLNDPNGFIQKDGVYHLFFQWMPFDTTHGAKYWGHYSSKDLVNWKLHPIGLAPSDWFDKNGCYSGSAIEHNGYLKLFYTGNVKDEEGNRETYQCLAVSKNDVDFEKKGVLINLPEGYTPHFRDPKVWKQDGKFFMVIGAQTTELKGAAVLYESENLLDWKLKGELARSGSEGVGDLGYMWECPDLFNLDGKDVLIFCPQGVEANGYQYNNVYQAGYMVGEFNPMDGSFSHGEFEELDRGFDFYAPQTTVDEKGRRLLVAWMAVPDQGEETHPTIQNRWIHNMTIPRVLKLHNGKVYQKPVEELKELRQETLVDEKVVKKEQQYVLPKACEIKVDIESLSSESTIKVDLYNTITLSFEAENATLTMVRKSKQNGTVEDRKFLLATELKSLHFYVDYSSVEVFVNEGEEVFTARFFPLEDDNIVTFESSESAEYYVKAWNLSKDILD